MIAIVQARLSSARLPGKMLMNVAGRPLLGRVVDRLAKARTLTGIVIATSSERSDQPIADFCTRENIKCHRGPLDDVAERFRRTAEREGASAFVRISGDSPLIDPALVDWAVGYYELGNCDLVTNVFVRTFPRGQSVEVVRTDAFRALCSDMDTTDREHVTRAFYRNAHAFRIVALTSGVDAGEVNFCIDTAEDLARIDQLITSCSSSAGWRELLAAYRSLDDERASTAR